MNARIIAGALGWVKVGQTDVGDRYPAYYDDYDDYRTPDGSIVSTESPYFEEAVAAAIRKFRVAAVDRLTAATGDET